MKRISGQIYIYISVILIISLYVYFSIGYTKRKITGEILSITIDHVVKERDFCRSSRIIIRIIIHNNTTEVLKIKNNYSGSECNYLRPNSNFWYINNDSIFPLTIIEDKDTSILIPAKSSQLVSFKFYQRIRGRSINEVLRINNKYINTNYHIKYIDSNNKFIFNKSKIFKIEYLLDNKRVDSKDSVLMNRKILSPPYINQ
jgi:hypothetical protein